MVLEHLDKALSDNSGSAQNSYRDFRSHKGFLGFYNRDSLGPRDALGLPLGGDALLVLNQEVRFPVYRWVQAVSFIDAGNILGSDESFAWSEVKIGYGAGLRFATPVGMLRVDFGIPGSTVPGATTREANSLRGGRWYFGIGHIF